MDHSAFCKLSTCLTDISIGNHPRDHDLGRMRKDSIYSLLLLFLLKDLSAGTISSGGAISSGTDEEISQASLSGERRSFTRSRSVSPQSQISTFSSGVPSENYSSSQVDSSDSDNSPDIRPNSPLITPLRRTRKKRKHSRKPKKSKSKSPVTQEPEESKPHSNPSHRNPLPSAFPRMGSDDDQPIHAKDQESLRQNLIQIQRAMLILAALTFIGIVIYSIYYINTIKDIYEKDLVPD